MITDVLLRITVYIKLHGANIVKANLNVRLIVDQSGYQDRYHKTSVTVLARSHIEGGSRKQATVILVCTDRSLGPDFQNILR